MPQPVVTISTPSEPAPLRRRKAAPAEPAPSRWRTRLLNYVIGFVAVILVVDALVGDKGLMDTIRARRQHARLTDALAKQRQDNARLRDEIRRLKEDPATIESLARDELGLMRDGEVVFILRDAAPGRR
jgi:cell division protein FtsB